MTGSPSVIRLANDVSAQFEHKPHDAAVEAIARHLNSFWDPRMRRELADVADSYRGDLRAIVFDVLPALHLDTPSNA